MRRVENSSKTRENEIFCVKRKVEFGFRCSFRSLVNNSTRIHSESRSNVETELFLHQLLTSWKDGFTELIIYIEERFRNNQKASDNEDQVRRVVFFLHDGNLFV